MAKSFCGSYVYQMDDKGRTRLPSEMRSSLGSDLHIGYGTGQFLVIYTAESYERECERQEQINPFTDRAGTKYYRNLFISMKPFDCDMQGRFKIPAEFRTELGFKDEVIVVGHNKAVEIWSKKYFDRRDEDEVAFYRLLTQEEQAAADERTAMLDGSKK